MRRLAFLCLAFLPLLPARAASAADGLLRQAQYVDPCHDGRISDGKARSCEEIRRWLRHRDRGWERRPRRHERYDPCTDGSVSDGRPRTCRELRRWFYNPDLQDWD
jgi:hypothetical protein